MVTHTGTIMAKAVKKMNDLLVFSLSRSQAFLHVHCAFDPLPEKISERKA